MPFFIQYCKTTGRRHATGNMPPPEDTLPEDRAQLVFDQPVEWLGKKVDLATLTLVDAPPEED